MVLTLTAKLVYDCRLYMGQARRFECFHFKVLK